MLSENTKQKSRVCSSKVKTFFKCTSIRLTNETIKVRLAILCLSTTHILGKLATSILGIGHLFSIQWASGNESTFDLSVKSF